MISFREWLKQEAINPIHTNPAVIAYLKTQGLDANGNPIAKINNKVPQPLRSTGTGNADQKRGYGQDAAKPMPWSSGGAGFNQQH